MKTHCRFVGVVMSSCSEREYLLRRFAQERELACSTRDRRAAQIHFSMAYEYERRLSLDGSAADERQL